MRVLKIALAFVLALGGTFMVAPAASAHHPVVSGVAVCDTSTGLYNINWTVKPDAKRGKEWKVNTASLAGPGRPQVDIQTDKWKSDSESVTGTTSQVPAGTYTLTVKASWKGGPNNETRSGSVTAGGSCERTKPDKPQPEVVTESREDKNCTAREITTYVKTTTTDWVFDTTKWEWVKGQPVVTETSSVRPATTEECPVVTTPPTTEPPVTTPPTTQPPVTTPPVTTPPVATTPPVVVPSTPAVVPTPQAPPATNVERTTNQVEELAYTGNMTWAYLLAGLILLGAGVAAVFGARRKDYEDEVH